MSARTCIVDLRGVSGWTKAQRQRRADLGLVSPSLTANPLVLMENVGVHTAPGALIYNDKAPTWGSLSHLALELVDGHPLPDGERMVLWSSGLNVLYGLNLANPDCALGYADAIAESCSWAKGVCFDYFTTYGWLLEARPGGMPKWATSAWFADFDAGIRVMVARLRQLQREWWIYGYQYHSTPATSALDGPFIEDRYTRNSPLDFIESYAKSIAAARGAPDATAILEIRNPETFSAQRIADVSALCERNGWYLSRGKDAAAVGGI